MSDERLRRWRLALGGGEADGTGIALAGDDLKRDQALERLYDAERSAGLGASSPTVVRWLGDIRTYFPSSVVSVMQQDALERLNLRRMLLEPELLATIQPDLHLATELIALGGRYKQLHDRQYAWEHDRFVNPGEDLADAAGPKVLPVAPGT